MTKYEILMQRASECTAFAKKTQDKNLRVFFINASNGFKQRALNLTIGDAKMRQKDIKKIKEIKGKLREISPKYNIKSEVEE